MKKILLLDIDNQIDFIKKTGNLPIPGAEEIVPNIQKVIIDFSENELPIISTIDDHQEDDEEFKVFPPHCISGSNGGNKIPESFGYLDVFPLFLEERPTEEEMDLFKQFIISKETYNVWDPVKGNPQAVEDLLNYFKPEAIFVIGVATDICVKAAVEHLKEHYDAQVYLITDAMKGLEGEQAAIEFMVSKGAICITTKDLHNFL